MEQFGTKMDELTKVEKVLRYGNTKTPHDINMDKNKKKKTRAWQFTYNNFNMENLEQFTEKFKDLGCEYIFQLEEVSCKHLQGAIYFKSPRNMSFQQGFNNTIHWERGRNWRNLKKYCCKLESRIDGPWTNIPGLKFRKTIKDPLRGKKLYTYQKFIKEIIKEEPDDRTIYWFYEKIGNTGKSSLCKHLKLKYKNKLISVSGKSKDVIYAISSVLENDEDIDIIIYDIPRSNIDYISYTGMEKIKDGYCFSGKYESKEILINSPHIICFANELPNTGKMSKDRWKIYELIKSHDDIYQMSKDLIECL